MKTAAPPERIARLSIQVVDDYEALCRAGADHFVETVRVAITRQGRAAVVLSGGSTPRGMYALLATEPYFSRVHWNRVHVFWGDERCVPPDSPQSNYRMAYDAMLTQVPIPPQNVWRMHAESSNLAQAGNNYEAEIRAFFNQPEGLPVFDLIHLGMGDDGHTASLFPHTHGLNEETALVTVNRIEKMNANRMTLTYPVLNAAANVQFLVSGESKAAVVREVLEGPYDPVELPSSGVQPVDGSLIWLLDKAAAAQLSPGTRASHASP